MYITEASDHDETRSGYPSAVVIDGHVFHRGNRNYYCDGDLQYVDYHSRTAPTVKTLRIFND
jgi:hypothetical protein